MASSKPSSSRIASLLALITTFACVFAGNPPPPPVAERTCSVLGEKLTLFNQETAFLFLPCKYRLADFKCGDYRVKVTPGSSVDADNFYSPVSVWVKVVNTVTSDTVKLRTSLGLLERAEAGTIDNAWKIKEGNTSFLDFAGYDGGIARVEKDGVFTVQFSNNSVQVSCVAPDFSSPGVPETLCGDGSTVDEVKVARSALLEDTDLDLEQFLQYIILNDTTVTQSEQCVVLTNNFQQCQRREVAALRCSDSFSSQSLVQCLTGIGTSPQDVYDYCVRKTCYDDGSNRPEFGDCRG